MIATSHRVVNCFKYLKKTPVFQSSNEQKNTIKSPNHQWTSSHTTTFQLAVEANQCRKLSICQPIGPIIRIIPTFSTCPPTIESTDTCTETRFTVKMGSKTWGLLQKLKPRTAKWQQPFLRTQNEVWEISKEIRGSKFGEKSWHLKMMESIQLFFAKVAPLPNVFSGWNLKQGCFPKGISYF